MYLTVQQYVSDQKQFVTDCTAMSTSLYSNLCLTVQQYICVTVNNLWLTVKQWVPDCTAICVWLYSNICVTVNNLWLTVQQSVTDCKAKCSWTWSNKYLTVQQYTKTYALHCSQGPPISIVLLSMSADHSPTSNFHMIYINTIVHSSQISSKYSFRFRNSDWNLWLVIYL